MQAFTISFWVSSELLKSVLEDLEHCCLSSWRYFLRQGWTGELCSKRNRADGSSLLWWSILLWHWCAAKPHMWQIRGATFHLVNMWHCYFQALQLSFESRLRTERASGLWAGGEIGGWVLGLNWFWRVNPKVFQFSFTFRARHNSCVLKKALTFPLIMSFPPFSRSHSR